MGIPASPASLTARHGARLSMECSRLDPRSNQLFLLDDVVKANFASAINQKQPIALAIGCIPFCGEEGIRTPGTRKRTPVFEAGSFNHSDTSPLGLQIYD